MIPNDVERIKQAFGDQEFDGLDAMRVLGMTDKQAIGSRFKYMLNRNMIVKTKPRRYRFIDATSPVVPQTSAAAHAARAPEADPPACAHPIMVKVGDLYLHERLLLVVDVASDHLRVYTPIIEIDPATKHPRNKVITFYKQRDPREYAQVMAWLDSMAGTLPAVDDTALELAAELEQQLNAARQEIASLKARIETIRGAL